MAWYWVGLIGGILTPLVIAPKTIMVAFQERGIGTGLAAWSGMCWLTVPAMMLVLWITHLMVG